MDVAQIVKSTQEQGVAAWVDYLNQLRLNELLAKLTSQNMNLEQALAELQKMKDMGTETVEKLVREALGDATVDAFMNSLAQ